MLVSENNFWFLCSCKAVVYSHMPKRCRLNSSNSGLFGRFCNFRLLLKHGSVMQIILAFLLFACICFFPDSCISMQLAQSHLLKQLLYF